MEEPAEGVNEVEQLSKLIEEAEEVAKAHSLDGTILGRVTRFETVKVGGRPEIKVVISFDDYIKSRIARGEYLAIASVISKVIVLGQVDEIQRSDLLAQLGVRELSVAKDPASLMTSTIVTLKPISELDYSLNGTPRPVISPIDPQSPVFRPNRDVLSKLLRIPEQGVKVGKVFDPKGESETEVKLDPYTLVHHVLIIGTTGAGKTTLLKTVLADQFEKQTVVFDRQGDYVRFALEKLPNAVVIVPLTTSDPDLLSLVNARYCNGKARRNLEDPEEVACQVDGKTIAFYPFTIRFREVMYEIPNISPYMSLQASSVWNAVINKSFSVLKDLLKQELKLSDDLVTKIISQIKESITLSHLVHEEFKFQNVLPASAHQKTVSKKLNKEEEVILLQVTQSKELIIRFYDMLRYTMTRELSLAWQTRDNIERNIRTLYAYGIFDRLKSLSALTPELLSKASNIVIDLSFLLESTESVEALSIVVYKLLNDIYDYKDQAYKQGNKTPLTLLIMDEAHEFFPQAKGEMSKESIERMINRILRLGRVRGLGAVLATHMPDDLNPLVLQLTNTKVIMRNYYDVLKKLDAMDYADVLINAQPGLALIRSINYTDLLIQASKV
ncbi:MAG: ATP-binding protein [Thermoprotei archaeon]